MCTLDMPRKPRLFRLDDRVLDGLDDLATTAGTNTNQFVEGILFDFLKHAGKLSKEEERLKDGRGGDRYEKKRADKAKTTPSANTVDPTSTPADRSGGEVSGIEN
jgi:hypothetical protein